MKKITQFILTMTITSLIIVILFPTQTSAKSTLEFTDEEKAFIQSTNQDQALKIGIIPHTFPLSDCPPDSDGYVGINVEMLKLISQKTGLQFEYGRIPIENETPYQSLINNEFTFVAGTIRLESFMKNPNLILSQRFCDGSSICIALKNTNPKDAKTNKVAVMSGYQAGMDFSKTKFPNHEVVFYRTNQDVMKAVRNGEVDCAMISRYVGIYELENPLNDKLIILAPYQTVVDSCIMGLNTQENTIAMSIINKALSDIGDEEYNHIQINFTITNPYDLTLYEFLYKYRYVIFVCTVGFTAFTYLLIKLFRTQKDKAILSKDSVTGAYSELGFELAVKKVLQKSHSSLFITVFDMSYFSSYNELHGKDKGDELLKKIVEIVCSFISEQDIICRSYADNFIVLSCKDNLESLIQEIKAANAFLNELLDSRMVFSFGIYQITDYSIPVSKMIDFASIAKKKIKGDADNYICVFNDELRKKNINDVKMLASFNKAIANKEFVAYYQPKFDVNTQKVIGAEALVRWILNDGTVIPPIQFIELFEKNGQIQRLDFYMLEQTCMFQKSLIENNIQPIPISINFSRVHLYNEDFVSHIKETVERFNIPKYLIEIECTETVMTYNTELSIEILGQLRELGFKIAMDDFGKAYSALNTLRSMPLDIVKLDSDFFNTSSIEEIKKSRKIIQAIVSLVHDLSLKLVAEGVETEKQYLFLKDIGCDYIQGYYFSKPLEEKVFLDLITKNRKD
ncbi:MAG: EAL domain-containing protein [Coprobacillus sp.]